MKKIFAILVVLLLSVAVTSCGPQMRYAEVVPEAYVPTCWVQGAYYPVLVPCDYIGYYSSYYWRGMGYYPYRYWGWGTRYERIYINSPHQQRGRDDHDRTQRPREAQPRPQNPTQHQQGQQPPTPRNGDNSRRRTP